MNKYSRYQIHGFESWNAHRQRQFHHWHPKISAIKAICLNLKHDWRTSNYRWTLLQKQRRPIVPLWNWGPCPSSPANTGEEREIVNIHRQPTQLYLIRSLLDVRAGSNQKKVRVLLTMMKTTSHAAPINNKMSFCINVSSMKDALIPHLSPCLACKSINQTVPTGCTLIHHRPWK